MKGKVILVALIFLLLIAVRTLPFQTHTVPEVHLPENFQNHSEELERLNITNPYEAFYSKMVDVSCFPGSEKELRRLFSLVEEYPHGDVYFDGEERFLVVLPVNENVSRELPSSCIITDEYNWGIEAEKILEDNAKKLVLYEELSKLVRTPEEKAFVSEKLSQLKESANCPKLHPANATSVWVEVKYAPSIYENVHTLTGIWALVFLLALVGAVLYLRDRKILAFFLVALLLATIFLGYYAYGEMSWEKRLEAMEHLKGLGEEGRDLKKGCSELYLIKEVRGLDDARDIEILSEEFNLTFGLERIDVFEGGECAQLYSSLESSKARELKERALELGMIPTFDINGTENCDEILNSLRLENEILSKYLGLLSPESREVARQIITQNEREISEAGEMKGLYNVWVNACTGIPYPKDWLLKTSRTLAEWGLLMGTLIILIRVSEPKSS